MTTVHAQTGIKLATKPAKTSLLGGHFIYKANGTGETPSSANVVEWVDNDPTLWRHNVHIGSSGIKLRYGETTLSKWDTNSLIFYKTRTEDGSTVTDKGIELSETNGLVLYKTTFDASNLTAEISESTITNVSVSIIPTTFLSMIDTVGEHRFTYSQADNGFLYGEEIIRGADLFDVFGIVMQPDADEHIGPFDGEYIVVKVFIPAVVEKGIQLSSAGLEIFGSSQSTADVIVNSSGIKLIKGGIEAGTKNTTDYIYVWSNDDSNHSITIGNSTAKTDWRIIAGNKFGIDKAGNVYATNADITGIIKANEGSIGGDNGWTISSQEIKSTDYNITQTGSIYLSTKDLTTATTINGQSRTDWRFTIGDKFGVTSDGYLYANGSFITDITASSLNIGPVVKYYVCDTAKATQAKRIDNVPNFTLTAGLTINVTFTYGNSYSRPTLNINDTGAISIMAYDGSDFSSSYEYNIAANSSRTFTYNGTYWLLQDNGAGDAYYRAYNAEDVAYGYITTISGIDGISVRKKWDNTNFVNIRDDGIYIYKTLTGESSPTDVAFFGESARVGAIANSTSRVEITSGGIDLISRSSNGIDEVLAHFGYSFNRNGDYDGGTIENSKTSFYILGCTSPSSTNPYGKYSVSEGNSIAWGSYSHAEGFYTKGYGANSHSEGEYSIAQGSDSHAEGYWTQATGTASHAEGYYSKTKQAYSHAQNQYTRAFKKAQTAIGTYNAEDKSNTTTHPSENAIYGQYAFIIGNGTGDGDAYRSNALAVAWNGNITVANHTSHIGDYKYHAPSDVSCDSGKYYELAYLELDPGIWLIDVCGHFPNTNSTGFRNIRVTTAAKSTFHGTTSAPPAAPGNIAIDQRKAAESVMFPNVHFPVRVTSTTTYRVVGYQSSGSKVSANGRIYAVRIQ